MAECSNSGSCGKSSCEGCASKEKSNPQNFMAEQNVFSDVKHVIGVVSGKGGVGKSLVTGSLANAMAAKGYKVGILDADITGPSIPKMYGVHGSAVGCEAGIYPMRYSKRHRRLCPSIFFFQPNILLLSGEDRCLQHGNPVLD